MLQKIKDWFRRGTKIPRRCRWCIHSVPMGKQIHICSKNKSSFRDPEGKCPIRFAHVHGDERCGQFKPFVQRYETVMKGKVQ